MTNPIGELNPPTRLMMTPGPCSIDPRVYRALAMPIVGHLDPWFRGCMEETQVLMRQLFQTENRVTFPLSASGSGGIEASVLNSLEPGDEAICCVNGLFSQRMHVIAQHTPATVHLVDVPYGKPVDAEDVRKAAKGRKIKMIGFAQGETSSGVLTAVDPIRQVADECGALLVVDTVASLAAVPLHVDKQRIDICFSGSQKAISAPPGMSPITVSSRAEEAFRNRKTKVQSWYFDLTTAMNYWGKDRLYHHTPPISLIYALREAMRILLEEGLDPDRIVIGHADSYPYLDYYLELLERGASVEFDFLGMRFSPVDEANEPRVLRLLLELLDRGHGEHLLLSQDVCHTMQLTAFGGNGYTYLQEKFLPRLRAAGADEATIAALTVENPRRVLSLAGER